MRPRVFINIDTANIGGPGKGLLQFLRHGGTEVCDPVVVGYASGHEKRQFDRAMEKTRAPFEQLRERMAYDPFLVPQALRLARKCKPDILQSHGYKSHVLCLILKRFMGLPWIAFVHGWTSENFKMSCYNTLDKFILGFADRVVTVSRSQVRLLNPKWIDGNKVRTIPNAVDPAECAVEDGNGNIRATYGIAPDAPLLGVVGRFSPEKGHMVLVKALPAILRDHPRTKVMFVGDGQEKKAVLKKLKELGLAGGVVFAGYQEHMGPLYRAMDLVVLPSLSEGMPNVALEAMIHGKPVVATRVGGVPEVVVDGVTGSIVEPQNPVALGQSIRFLLGNNERMKTYGLAGRTRVLNEFNPAQRVWRFAALYEEVLNSLKGEKAA